MDGVVVLDSDLLSELSRGHPKVVERSRDYLERHGCLTITAVTVFERLRGYHAALRLGKPYEPQLRQFQGLVATSRVLPLDEPAAERAALIWAELSPRRRRAVGDIFIAGIASARALPLATRNLQDFLPIAKLSVSRLTLVDWSR